jgi:hypothetical protein
VSKQKVKSATTVSLVSPAVLPLPVNGLRLLSNDGQQGDRRSIDQGLPSRWQECHRRVGSELGQKFVDASLCARLHNADRRIHERLKTSDLEWLGGARVKYGAAVRIMDISAGGLLLETEKALKPKANVVLELTGPDSPMLIPSKVVGCSCRVPGRHPHIRSCLCVQAMIAHP